MRIEGAKVLVTGGAGLIGSTTIDHLIDERPASIVVFDDFSRGRTANLDAAMSSGLVEVIEGDIGDRGALRAAMDGADLVFHFAAIRITRCAEEPRRALEVLVDGSFNVAEAAVDAAVSKVVVASSASVYGLATEFPTPETQHPYGNRTLYGAAKAFDEGLFRSFSDMYGLPYVALRYFNVYGPRMDIFGAYTEVLIRWMERIEAGAPPLIFGDGSQTMDFVEVSDVARANVAAAASERSDIVVNVASGVETSLDELARRLIAVMGADLTPEYGEARKVNGVTRRLADTSSAQELLGFRSSIDLDEGLRRLVAWWREERRHAAPA